MCSPLSEPPLGTCVDSCFSGLKRDRALPAPARDVDTFAVVSTPGSQGRRGLESKSEVERAHLRAILVSERAWDTEEGVMVLGQTRRPRQAELSE